MTAEQKLAEVSRLLERWKEVHDFAMADLTRQIIGAVYSDLRAVLAGKRVSELAPCISDEDRKAKAETLAILGKLEGKPPEKASN